MILVGALLCLCALMVALLRELRWSVLAYWGACAGAAAIFLARGSEMMAVALLIAASLKCAVYFLHADVVAGAESDRSEKSLRESRAGAVIPAFISIMAGFCVMKLLELVCSVQPEAGATPVDSVPTAFVVIQLSVLIAVAAAIGSGLIARPEGSDS